VNSARTIQVSDQTLNYLCTPSFMYTKSQTHISGSRKCDQLINITISYVVIVTCFGSIKHVTRSAFFSIVACIVWINELNFVRQKSNPCLSVSVTGLYKCKMYLYSVFIYKKWREYFYSHYKGKMWP
jgi:hypothetical protein